MLCVFASPLLAALAIGSSAEPAAIVPATASREFSPAELFALADAARDRGDFALAERAYRALADHLGPDLRTEARFRLALMLANREHRLREAAILLREILDEKPNAARVRLELARIDAQLGRVNDAGRELRAASASGLPSEVEQAVRFFSQALDARRPVGASLAVAVVPDSNVNRSTAATTLDTIVGTFTLDRQAQARSGLGFSVQGQGFGRLVLSPRTNVLLRLSGNAVLYRDNAFDDIIVAPQVGPELALGKDSLSLAIGPAWRWYGMVPYTFSLSAEVAWRHPLGRTSQLRVSGSGAHVTNRFNALQSGGAYALAVGLDHAFSARLGGGVQLSAGRQGARDPGYATASGGIGVYGWRELGPLTVSANFGYSHLEGDTRLSLFTARRIDNTYSAAFGLNLRRLRVGSVSPQLRLRYERNTSSVAVYDYRRIAGEIGVAAAF